MTRRKTTARRAHPGTQPRRCRREPRGDRSARGRSAKRGAKLVLLQELHNGPPTSASTSRSPSSTWPNRSRRTSTERMAKLAKQRPRASSVRSSRSAPRACTTTPRWCSNATAPWRASTARCTSPTIRASTRSSTSRRATSASNRQHVRRRLGVMVCWDQWYPEGARLMALAGAELLLYPTAIGWDPDDDRRVGSPAQRLDPCQRGHAVANGLPVLSCNRVGHEPSPLGAWGIRFWGSSHVLGLQGVPRRGEHRDAPES